MKPSSGQKVKLAFVIQGNTRLIAGHFNQSSSWIERNQSRIWTFNFNQKVCHQAAVTKINEL